VYQLLTLTCDAILRASMYLISRTIVCVYLSTGLINVLRYFKQLGGLHTMESSKALVDLVKSPSIGCYLHLF